MNHSLKVSESIEINASVNEIWDALVNPHKIKIYLFGTETITDWKVGSPIIFQGEYEGQTYKDKGNVLENNPYKTLKYNYWSGFSGLADLAENYSVITYSLKEKTPNMVEFTWLQEGFSSEEGQAHSQNGMAAMLQQIKALAETK